jgi:2-polyprenyl-3-methyl-5-hydroxy-6-metoxy-1,4-benzoquinol methylase
MPVFLSNRDTDSQELMDNPACDTSELFNTYRQFKVINALISRWRSIYKTNIRPLFPDSGKSYSLLDIGFGGGDIPIKIAGWAAADGIDLRITAIETDPRAYRFASRLSKPDNVTFLLKSSTQLLESNQRFDVVVSNHLLHHLDQITLPILLSEARQLSRKAVFFSDIERSDIGYLLFSVFSRPVFRSSFITSDGLTSIKRSYTFDELNKVAPEGWTVHRLFPYRLLLSYSHV